MAGGAEAGAREVLSGVTGTVGYDDEVLGIVERTRAMGLGDGGTTVLVIGVWVRVKRGVGGGRTLVENVRWEVGVDGSRLSKEAFEADMINSGVARRGSKVARSPWSMSATRTGR